ASTRSVRHHARSRRCCDTLRMISMSKFDAAQAAETPEPSQSAEVVEAAEIVVDQAITSARALAREALEEITDAKTIGADDGFEAHDEHTATLYFECTMPGYPGWRWAAALTRVDDESPVTVLEVELLPGEGAVLAPEWVPWSERLAQ